MVTRVGKELGVEIICAQTDYEGEMCQLVSFPLPSPWGICLRRAAPGAMLLRRSPTARFCVAQGNNHLPLTPLNRAGALLSVSRRRSHESGYAQPDQQTPLCVL